MDLPLDDHASTLDAPKPRQLPADLPTSLDDRRVVNVMTDETEMYDAWQGECPGRTRCGVS